MNYSDSIKAILLAAINDLSKTPEKYAVKPGVDFIRNRKLGFKDYMLMFLTMEADCIREEMYRFFGRTIDAPSKAAFYRQCKKIREDAFRNLLLAFNRKLPKKLYNDKYESDKDCQKLLSHLKNYIMINMNSGPVMVLPVIFSLTLKIRIPILNQMVNLPEDLTRSISMLCFLYLISVLLIF